VKAIDLDQRNALVLAEQAGSLQRLEAV